MFTRDWSEMVSDSGLWSILYCLAKLRLMSGRVIVRRITMRVAFQSAISNGRTEWFSPFCFSDSHWRFLNIFCMRFENIGRRPIMIRGERERVQITFNFRQTLGNAGRMCVSITPPLSIRLRELLESFILHTCPGKKKKLSFHREIYNCLVVFGFFLF